jgi:hypothetical protein
MQRIAGWLALAHVVAGCVAGDLSGTTQDASPIDGAARDAPADAAAKDGAADAAARDTAAEGSSPPDVGPDFSLDPSEAFTVKFSESTGRALDAEPITIGVPLKRGLVGDANDVHIEGVASQNRLLSRWPDGSAQWVLLDFQADLEANESREVKVYADTPRREPRGELILQEQADQIIVTTGPLKVQIGREGFGLLERIWFDANGDGIHTLDEIVTDPKRATKLSFGYETKTPEGVASEKYSYIWLRRSRGGTIERRTVKPTSVTTKVLEQGPLRAVVELRGRFATPDDEEEGDFTIHLTFYSGKPYFALRHHFVFSYDNRQSYLRSLELEIPLALSGPLRYLAQPGATPSEDSFSTKARLNTIGAADVFLQPEHANAPIYVLDIDGVEKETGKSAHGWLGIRNDSIAMGVGLRDFAERYPAALQVKGGSEPSLVLELWPEADGWVVQHGEYASEPRGTGMGHEAVVMFAKPRDAAQQFANRWRAFDKPIYPVTDPNYVFGDLGLFPLVKPYPCSNKELESFWAASMALWIRSQTRYHLSGLFNWGDSAKTWKKKDGAWTIGIRHDICYDEYDGFAHHNNFVDYYAALEHLRTGFVPYRRYWERSWRHNRDTATVQWVPHADLGHLGLGLRHSAHQWGTWRDCSGCAYAPCHSGRKTYGMDFLSGWLHWNLTGDWRTLQGLETYAERYKAANAAASHMADCDDGSCGGVFLYLLAMIPGYEGVRDHAGELLASTYVDQGDGSYRYPWHDAPWSSIRTGARPLVQMLYYVISEDPRAASAYSAWANRHRQSMFAEPERNGWWSGGSELGFAHYLTRTTATEREKWRATIEQNLRWKRDLRADLVALSERVSDFGRRGFSGLLHDASETELMSYIHNGMEAHQMQYGLNMLLYSHLF